MSNILGAYHNGISIGLIEETQENFTYSVWGLDYKTSYSSDDLFSKLMATKNFSDLNPRKYGAKNLGISNSTKKFYGNYNMYFIEVNENQELKIDAVQLSDGSYYGENGGWGIKDWGHKNWKNVVVPGYPDGKYSTLSNGNSKALFIFNMPSCNIKLDGYKYDSESNIYRYETKSIKIITAN